MNKALPPDIEAKIAELVAGATADELAELNALYAVVTTGAKVRIMTLQEDPPIFYAPEDFKLLIAARPPVQVGTKTVAAATWWLSHPHRRQYRGIIFEPGSPQEVNGYRNTWTGFSVEPKAGDCSLFTDFLRGIICADDKDHYEYLLDVMADTVQRPYKQGEVAVVLRGEEGVGKGCTVKNFGSIFGHHFCRSRKPHKSPANSMDILPTVSCFLLTKHSMQATGNMRQH